MVRIGTAREVRRALSLPASTRALLQDALDTLAASHRPRAWCLPETTVADEVRHYAARHEELSLRGPRPALLAEVSAEHAEKIALHVSTGLEYLDLATQTSESVRPVLLYYSAAHLTAALSRAFLTWVRARNSHGLSVRHDRLHLENTALSYASHSGAFQSLTTALFLLKATPTPFSEMISFSSSPTAWTEPGERLERFGTTEIGASIQSLRIGDLTDFDAPPLLERTRQRFGFHKFSSRGSTAFLADLSAIYLACELARYEPRSWKSVLAGVENTYRLGFESSFDRYVEFAVDRLLMMMVSPDVDFASQPAPGVSSPYERLERRGG